MWASGMPLWRVAEGQKWGNVPINSPATSWFPDQQQPLISKVLVVSTYSVWEINRGGGLCQPVISQGNRFSSWHWLNEFSSTVWQRAGEHWWMVRIAAEMILCILQTQLPKLCERPWTSVLFGNSQRIYKSREPHPGPLSAEAEFISVMVRKGFNIEILQFIWQFDSETVLDFKNQCITVTKNRLPLKIHGECQLYPQAWKIISKFKVLKKKKRKIR